MRQGRRGWYAAGRVCAKASAAADLGRSARSSPRPGSAVSTTSTWASYGRDAATGVEVLVVVPLRHRPRRSTLLGGPMATLAELLTGQPPAVWEAHEPAGNRWDRGQADRLRPGAATRPALLVGAGAKGSGRAWSSSGPTTAWRRSPRRTSAWVSQAPSGLSSNKTAWRPSSPSQPLPRCPWSDWCSLGRPGTICSSPRFLQQPPSPLALLIGPPGVRGLEIATEAMVQDFGAVKVGRPRLRGCCFRWAAWRTPPGPGWTRSSAPSARGRVGDVLGLSRRHTTSEAADIAGVDDDE